MKKIYKITAISLGVFALTACNDWLDTTSPSQLTEENIKNSVEDIQLATVGLYADLCSDPYIQLQTIHQGAGTDCELIDGLGEDARSGESERAALNYNASPAWAKLGTLWEKQYKTIEDCNRIMDVINSSNQKDNDAVMICSAEARVIRAMVYLDLIRVFGDIPLQWRGAKSDLSNTNVGKTDRDVILDALIADLEDVVTENKLPWCDQVTSEHVNMGYAKGLLANIYLTRAGYAIREAGGQAEGQPYCVASKLADGYVKASYSDDVYQTLRPSDAKCTELYTKAEQHLKDIIDKGVHDMNQTFAGFWDKINKMELDPTHESMFEIPMGFGLAGELGYTIGIRLNDETTDFGFTNSSGKLKTTAVQLYSYAPCDTRRDITCAAFTIRNIDRKFIAKENMKVDRDGIPGEKPDDLKEKDDDGNTIYIDVKSENSSDVTAERLVGNTPFELYIGKWDVRKMSDRWRQQNLTASLKFGYGINTIRMRYPQILLWYAECLAYRGDYSTAKTYIQKVHDRAYNDAVDSYTGRTPNDDKIYFNTELATANDYNTVLDLIDKENRLEFCGECFRKWDLIRWNRLHDDIVEAKKTYYKYYTRDDEGNGVFQTKVYFKYKDYSINKDDNGNYFYSAPEKMIDMSSITWYGTDGTNTTTGTVPKEAWFNSNGYRYASSTAYNPDDNKGYKYLGFGKSNKDLNNRSYANDAFGKDYEKLDDYLPSICSGLVGDSKQYDTATEWKDEFTDKRPRNRYLMPIFTNTIQSSEYRLYNSYGY